MVGKNYMVKVSDHAIYCAQYENDYYITDKKSRLPIRWMAWESVLLVSALKYFIIFYDQVFLLIFFVRFMGNYLSEK